MPSFSSMSQSPAFDALKRNLQTAGETMVKEENFAHELTPPPPGFVNHAQAPDLTEVTMSEEDAAALGLETTIPVVEGQVIQEEQPITHEEVMEVINETPDVVEEVAVVEETSEVKEEVVEEPISEETPSESENVSSAPELPEETEEETVENEEVNSTILLPTKTITQAQLRRIRINKPGEDTGPICSQIQCQALKSVLDTYFKTHEIFDEVTILGTQLKSGDEDGLWMEGGATKYQSHVLLVGDKNAQPLTPLAVSLGRKVVNGRNALVVTNPGRIILFGGRYKDKEIICLYVVNSVGADAKTSKPEFYCEAIVAFSKDLKNGGAAEKVAIMENPPIDFSEDHPMIQAARAQMDKLYARTPIFVNEFKDIRVNPADFNKAIASDEAKNNFAVLPLLEDAKAGALECAKQAVWGVKKNEHVVVHTYFTKQNDRVVIYYLVTLYNLADKATTKTYKVYAAPLTEGGSFTYLGDASENAIPYERLSRELDRSNGSMLMAQRCLVGSEEMPTEEN